MTKRLSGLALALVMLLGACATGPQVETGRASVTIVQGELAGVREENLAVFRGIPYAQPPVGDLRWRPPQPAPAWTGVRDAAAFGPSCPQPELPQASVYRDEPAAKSEDCLTLNVWAPQDAEGLPVVVWIHGGSLRMGGSAQPMYDGARFAKRGIVFVSINYRLGPLGWLAHPELSAESLAGISGNYGLLDQMAALRWIRDNVARFGGNPDEVTVMGESAGALSIAYLMVSPDARGLFDRAIIQSPNLRAVPVLDKQHYGLPTAESIGEAVAARAGAQDVAALRALDAEAVLGAAAAAGFVAQPTIDGSVLPQQAALAFSEGKQASVPVLAGFNMGEMRSMGASAPPGMDSARYRQEIERRYGEDADAFLRLYPEEDVRESVLAVLRDAIFGWAAEKIVRSQADLGVPSYFYVFDHCYTAARERDLCAFHASELPFVFGQVGEGTDLSETWPRPEGPEALATAAAMTEDWTRFIKTGAPAAGGGWPTYAPGESYMDFGPRPEVSRDPLSGMFEFHERTFRARQAGGEQWFTNVGIAAPEPVE